MSPPDSGQICFAQGLGGYGNKGGKGWHSNNKSLSFEAVGF